MKKLFLVLLFIFAINSPAIAATKYYLPQMKITNMVTPWDVIPDKIRKGESSTSSLLCIDGHVYWIVKIDGDSNNLLACPVTIYNGIDYSTRQMPCEEVE